MLEYVPYFRGRLFIVHVAQSLLDAEELVDALLDLDVLHEIGVRLVIIAEGNDISGLFARTRVCEMRSAAVEMPLTEGEAVRNRVQEIVRRNQIPVVASGSEGVFDEGSIQLAVGLHADKLIVLLDDDRVVGRDVEPIHAILESEVDKLQGPDVFLDILKQAAAICRKGIPRVHLLDGRNRGVLVDELFSEEGVGTMVHTDSYREIRPLREEDIPELLSMIARSMVDSKLVERSYEDFAAHLDYYYVFTLDDSIIGCVGVYPYPENNSAELGCLYIKRSHEGLGYGRALCAFAEEKARELGAGFMYAISQSAVYYFRDRLKYAEYSRDMLPPSRRQALEASGRKSGVFGRML